MFTALYLREWKEKALLFFFELGVLVLLVLAQIVYQQKKDVQEWLAYAVLLLFFPFAALILGSGGFEAEFRQGSWAYLFSRPVRKTVIWLAKFAALLSMLAALWLVFLATWPLVPGLKGLVGGTRVLLGFTIQSGFPWWSLWQSVFLLTVSFSLSLLHERQFNILFLSLIAALGLTAAAWAVLNSKAGGHVAWVAPQKALPTFLVSQVLIALAFAAASILTLARSDFSQSRKQLLGFAKWAGPFLVLALIGTAAWAVLSPLPSERYLYSLGSSGGEPYYVCERGVFKYSASANRIQWLAKAKHINFFVAAASGGKVAYTDFDIKNREDIAEELWVANADGSGRKRVLGREPREKAWPREAPIADLMISPDGTKIAILAPNHYGKRPEEKHPLWIVNTDGTGLENLPDEPSLFRASPGYYLHFVAWKPDASAIILSQRGVSSPKTYRLWLYDLRSQTARVLLENAVEAAWKDSVSPRGDALVVKYQKTPDAPWSLALLDLRTLVTTDISGGVDREGKNQIWDISWNPKGDRIAYVVRRTPASGPDFDVLVIYSVAGNKTIAERVMTQREAPALLYSPAWAAGGTELLILNRAGNCLTAFGPDLGGETRIAFPAAISVPTGLDTVGDQAFIEDDKTDTLWRLNLKDKSWKRIY